MARKPMMIEEPIEFDPAVQTEADAVRAEIAEAQRAARRKGKDKPTIEVDRPTGVAQSLFESFSRLTK